MLWTILVGNDHVKSGPYDAARNFITTGDEGFNYRCVHLDSRYLPHSDELQRRFGKFFNLIYVSSSEFGRVIAHFTLYNLISWQIILAEAEGTSGARIGLISNPLDPAVWSDTIADEIEIPFAWLDSPDYTDEFVRARERLEVAMRHYVETQRPRELQRIVDDVFAKNGIFEGNQPITDREVQNKIIWEISRRLAAHPRPAVYRMRTRR